MRLNKAPRITYGMLPALVVAGIFFIFMPGVAKALPWPVPDIPVFPKYENVVNQFFDTYAPEGLNDADYIKFAKMPDGWHIRLLDYDTHRQMMYIKQDLLYWSLKKHTYIKLRLHAVSSDKKLEHDIRKSLLDNDVVTVHYNTNPYYGYCGWDKDVIDLLEGRTGLNDTLLYAISEAYCNYGRSAIHLNYTDDCMSAKPTQSINIPLYVSSLKKCVAYVKILEERYPQFSTAVGISASQRGNDHVTAFLDLQMIHDSIDAQGFLNADVYTPDFIGLAKNYLNTCAPHAILFTSGDNDTYPLLYVQNKLGFRKDVTVVNTSLLGTYEYPHYLSEVDPALLNLAPILYRGTNNDYIMRRDQNFYAASESLNTLMHGLLDPDRNDISDTNDITNAYFDANGYYIVSAIPKLPYPDIDRSMALTDTMRFSLGQSKTYILKNEWLTLRIIQNQWLKRPIYFTGEQASPGSIGLDKYIAPEGICSRLLPVKNNTPDNVGMPMFNMDRAFKVFNENMTWTGLNTRSYTQENETRLFNNYRAMYYSLAYNLALNKRYDSALLVLNTLAHVLPETSLPYDIYAIQAIRAYRMAGDKAAATDMADKVLQLYKYTLATYNVTDISKSHLRDYAKAVQSAMWVFSSLKTEYAEMDNTDMTEKVDVLINKYMPVYEQLFKY